MAEEETKGKVFHLPLHHRQGRTQMIEVPSLFTEKDFQDEAGRWISPAAIPRAAQERFEEWFEKRFGRRIWVRNSDIVPGVDVHTRIYAPHTMKELPNESSCSEFWEVRKR